MALTKITGTGLETLSDGVTITTADNTAQLSLISTDTDASTGPRLDLYRNPGQAGTDSDNLAQLNFFGLNDASEKSQYLYLFGEMADVANGSEDVRFGFGGLVGGADSSLMTFTYGTQATGADPEMVFNDSSKDINFRVESNGNANMLFVDGGNDTVLVGKTASDLTTVGIHLSSTGYISTTTSGGKAAYFNRTGAAGDVVSSLNDSTAVGSISVDGSSTSYNESSDYRLKENVDYTWDATTRLKQLKPARFNFIADDTNTPVDGFLAHEVSSIVPAAISGEKDAVDSDGNPEHQGIDHSKLVPLLVKTIQELEARITALEG